MKPKDYPEMLKKARRAPYGKKRQSEHELRLSMAQLLAHGAPPAKRKRWRSLLDEAKAVPSPKKWTI